MFKFTWRIENFCMLLQNTGEYIDSPIFEIKNLDNLKAFIRLYPKGKSDSYFISFDLLPANKTRKFEKGTKIKISLTQNSYSSSKEVEADSAGSFELFWMTRDIFKDIDKYSNLFSSTENVEVECIIQEPEISESIVTCYGKTVIQVETHSYDLPIEEISPPTFWTKILEYSKHFSVEHHSNSFDLTVRKHLEKITVGIGKKCQIDKAVFVCCKVSLLSADENTELNCDRHLFKAGPEVEFWDIPFDLCESAMKKFITLRCEIIVSKGDAVSTLGKEYSSQDYSSKNNHNYKKFPISVKSGKNCRFLYKNMYEKKMFSDAILQMGTDQFPAHKCVLASISDVFTAMFTNKMKEEETSIVNITDINKDIVDKLLQFIYTGEVENLNLEDLVSLYSVADKYQILELKDLCSFHLSETLSMDSVLDVLELADMYHDCALEEAARNFIYANRNEVFNSDKWKCFMGKRIELAADIMLHCCKGF